MIYQTPACGPEELAAIERIERQWHQLQAYVPANNRRWIGPVRRMLAAQANQGSNSIEGFNVSTEDAIAIVEGGAAEPFESSWEDWSANLAYQRAMTYVLQLGSDSHFGYSTQLLRSLHFMMTEYDMQAGPGLLRPGAIWVQNDRTREVVYTAPDFEYVPALLDELSLQLEERDVPAVVQAAMAHLNLTLIHPFRDGNGRMARCLQALVLVRDGIVPREYSSIEEYLGHKRNQETYYEALARVAKGKWSPERSARSWVRYCLEAHYTQALSVLRHVRESEQMWLAIDALTHQKGLHDRTFTALYQATLGYRVRNSQYRGALVAQGEEIAIQTATSDLTAMVKAGLLQKFGAKRGTFYKATPTLTEIREKARSNRRPITTDHLFQPIEEDPEERAASMERHPAFEGFGVGGVGV